MAILLNNHGGSNTEWETALKALLPDLPIYVYPKVRNAGEIHYAVVWHHPMEDLFQYPNLKAVLILGAGMDYVDRAPRVPDVPIVRLVDPAVGEDMAQYVLYWVMHFQRGYETYRRQQTERIWQRHEYPMSQSHCVTILGAGQIASFIAQRVALNGFKVAVWSRSARKETQPNIEFFHGDDGLDTALQQARVLVNCLPYKPATEKFVDANVLAKLPTDAAFINVSRGAVVDEAALLSALDSNRLAAAAIDTLSQEPPADSHSFWRHPKIHLTPHMSGATFTRTAAKVVADNITRIESGEAPFPIYRQG